MSLRPLARADLEMVLVWRNHPQIRAFMYTRHEIELSEHLHWFERMAADPASHCFVHESDGIGPDGVVSVTQYRPGNRSAFWGFYAAPDAARGTGTRLGIETLDLVFGTFDVHKLNAEALAANARSLGFHAKLGFAQEGLFRDHHFDGDRFVDVVRFGMIRDEWRGHRARLIADLERHC